MQEQQCGPARALIPGFEQMHPKPVDTVNEVGPNAVRQGRRGKRLHDRLSGRA